MAKKSKLDVEIRRFVQEHPNGWGHGDWLGFVDHLGESGHTVPDTDSLGLALERERLMLTVQGCRIVGLGPKRTEAVCDAFVSVHNLRSAGPEEIAGRAGIPMSLAEELVRVLH